MTPDRKTVRYRTKGEIHSGSLFTLTKAIDEQDQIPVLVRRFATHLFDGDDGWRQFRQSLQEFSQIAVSGLLPVRQIGGSTRQPWLVFGGTDGTTLRERLASQSPAQMLDWLESVANTLTEIHTLGHVHGRVQSESIYFDQNDRPCLDELASVYALCGWDANHHELHPDFIGELFLPEYLAPELRAGGSVTPQTDQYSLAVVLRECLAGQPHNANDLRPVLARALADDPQQRFPTCRDLMSAVRQAFQVQKRRRRRRVGVVAGLLLLLAAGIGGKWEWDGRLARQEQQRVGDLKQKRRQEIVGDYELKLDGLRSIGDLSVSKKLEKLRADPASTEFVDGLLAKFGSRPAPTLPLKSLSEGSPPTVTLTFPSTSSSNDLNRADKVGKSFFLFTANGDNVVRLDGSGKIDWSIEVRWLKNAQRDATLSAAIVDVNDNIIGEKQTEKIPISLYQMKLPGTLSPTSLKLGDTLRPQVWLQEDGPPKTWQKTPTLQYRVGELEVREKVLKVSPSAVQAQKYELDSELDLLTGDHVRIHATGTITLGTASTSEKFQFDKAMRISPAGVVLSDNARRFVKRENLISVSGITSQNTWGSLLFRLGSQRPWEMVSTPPSAYSRSRNEQTEFETKRQIQPDQAGRLFLSINSVRYIGKSEVPKTAKAYWAGDDALDVRITVRSVKFPPDTSASTLSRLRRSLEQ